MAAPAGAGQAGAPMLMGGGPGQFNLEAVRVRAGEVRQSLVEVINALTVNASMLHWGQILEKYASINLQVAHLREALRGVLRQAVVHPCMVDHSALSNVLPIQLLSTVSPEQAQAEKQLLAGEEQRLLARGVPHDAWYEATDMQLEEFNRMVGALTGSGGCLDAQGEVRKGMAARSIAINRSLTAVRQGVLVPPAGGAAAVGAKRGRGAQDGGSAGVLDPALRQLLTGESSKR